MNVRYVRPLTEQQRALLESTIKNDFSPRLKPGVSWVRTKQETPNALPTPLAPPFLPIAKARGISEDLDERERERPPCGKSTIDRCLRGVVEHQMRLHAVAPGGNRDRIAILKRAG